MSDQPSYIRIHNEDGKVVAEIHPDFDAVILDKSYSMTFKNQNQEGGLSMNKIPQYATRPAWDKEQINTLEGSAVRVHYENQTFDVIIIGIEDDLLIIESRDANHEIEPDEQISFQALYTLDEAKKILATQSQK